MSAPGVDLLVSLFLGIACGICLTIAAFHFREYRRARRLQALLRKSILFRFRA